MEVMSGPAFSSDGLGALSRRVQTAVGQIKTEEVLWSYYEVERCKEFISSNDFHRVSMI